MEPPISLITLGVRDLDRARRFYRDGLGWPMSSAGAATNEVAFFHTRGAAIALYLRHLLAADASQPDAGNAGSFSGITLSHNVANREEVDAVLQHAVAAGAKLLTPAHTASWGGYIAYFADPDGHVWEVAWNPGFPLAADGSITLPT